MRLHLFRVIIHVSREVAASNVKSSKQMPQPISTPESNREKKRQSQRKRRCSQEGRKPHTGFLFLRGRLGISGLQDRPTETSHKLSLRAQEARHKKVKQGPQVQHIVLDGSPSQDQSVVCLKLFDGTGQLPKEKKTKTRKPPFANSHSTKIHFPQSGAHSSQKQIGSKVRVSRTSKQYRGIVQIKWMQQFNGWRLATRVHAKQNSCFLQPFSEKTPFADEEHKHLGIAGNFLQS